MKIIRNSVESSNVTSIGYLEDGGILEIEYRNGAVYRYADVPVILKDMLMKSESKGSFISKNIKDVFDCKKIEFLGENNT